LYIIAAWGFQAAIGYLKHMSSGSITHPDRIYTFLVVSSKQKQHFRIPTCQLSIYRTDTFPNKIAETGTACRAPTKLKVGRASNPTKMIPPLVYKLTKKG
jgi:hypothetical protein